VKSQPKVCIYVPDESGGPDHRGLLPCVCGLPYANKVHELPEVPKHVRDAEAARLGEHEGDT
jgi:hypothetical protein